VNEAQFVKVIAHTLLEHFEPLHERQIEVNVAPTPGDEDLVSVTFCVNGASARCDVRLGDGGTEDDEVERRVACMLAMLERRTGATSDGERTTLAHEAHEAAREVEMMVAMRRRGGAPS
jgi:hypothetical protein